MKNVVLWACVINLCLGFTTLYSVHAQPHAFSTHLTMCENSQAFIFNTHLSPQCL